MTPTELEEYVRQRYNAVGDSFYTQLEIMNYFWAAQLELSQETQCIRSIYTTTSVTDQRAYDFPTKGFSVARVEYDGERILPNDFIDDDGLTGNNPADAITGRAAHYQVWGSQIFLRPIPSETGLTIKIFSYDIPSQPTAAGTLDVPAYYHLMLADYALKCMFAKENKHQMAGYHGALWQQHKNTVLKLERARMIGDSFRVVKDREDLWDESRFI